MKVPVVFFSETYKFSDKVNLDAILHNEIGNPERLSKKALESKQAENHPLEQFKTDKNLILLNLKLDLTPANYIDMIICESGKIPAAAVPVVIREFLEEIEMD